MRRESGKNIAIIIGSMSGGGAERIAGLLSKHLSEKNNVYIFLFDANHVTYEYGGTIIDLQEKGSNNILSYMRKLKESLQIDCSISFLERPSFYNILSKGKDKVIISQRNLLSGKYSNSLSEKHNAKRLYKFADGIVNVSYGVQYDLMHYCNINEKYMTTIYNFIDKKMIIKKGQEDVPKEVLEFKGKSKLILHVGRLARIKNHRKLLKQFAMMVNDHVDAKLLLVGSGPLENEIKAQITELGIEKQVKIVDYCSNPFVFHKIADLFVLTSFNEGLPNALLEAMVLQTPIVAVDCLSGPRELLQENNDYSQAIKGYVVCKNGIVVEQTESDTDGQSEYLKQAMEYALTNTAEMERLTQNAYGYMENYSNEKILNQWMDVIENTVNRPCVCKEIIKDLLGQNKKFIIYGAGIRAKRTLDFLLELDNAAEVIAMAVTDAGKNPDSVRGVPVMEISKLVQHKEEAVVLVGVSDVYHDEVVSTIERYGFRYEYPYL